MTNVHSLLPMADGAKPRAAPKVRKSAMSEAEIGRYLRATHAAGFTVYAIEYGKDVLRVHTRPVVETASGSASDAEDWLRRNG